MSEQTYFNAIDVRSGEAVPMRELVAEVPDGEINLVYDFAVGTMDARPVVFTQAALYHDVHNNSYPRYNMSLLAFDSSTASAAVGARV